MFIVEIVGRPKYRLFLVVPVPSSKLHSRRRKVLNQNGEVLNWRKEGPSGKRKALDWKWKLLLKGFEL